MRTLIVRGISRIPHPLLYLACLCGLIALNGGIPSVAARKGSPAAPAKIYLPLIAKQAANPVYPLKVSSNNRYLVDQNNMPFLILGDSPQALIGALSESDADSYLANRAAAGINTVWVNVLCLDTYYSGCRADASTPDGILPFTTPNDLSTPNPAYFTRVDHILQFAANHGLLVLLDPIETGSWLPVLRSNGTTQAYNFGVYLGNRYKNTPNLLWLNGNDFGTWTDPTDDDLVRSVAQGIQSVDPNHLQTLELGFPASSSRDDPSWGSILGLDSAYSNRYPQYDEVLHEYNLASPLPIYFLEGYYEFQNYGAGYPGPHVLRAQAYWTQLSGSTGQLYGNANLYPFGTGWNAAGWDTTVGFVQFTYVKRLFDGRPWYNLVPDQSHTVVTAGYGTYDATVLADTNDYLTAARTSDGKLVIAYMPTLRTITVDMTKMIGTTVTARWYDPTNGTYTVIGSFAPSGSRQFTPPGNNSGGDGDWVLVLEAN